MKKKLEPLEVILGKAEFSDEEIVYLLSLSDKEDVKRLQRAAFDRTSQSVGHKVYYRGLIEVSNICTVNCRYCGIRKSNHHLSRYQMTKEEILSQAQWAAQQGFANICLQAGERHDEKFVSFICEVLEEIHACTVSSILPDGLGITLSLGDQTKHTLARWKYSSGNPNNLRYLARFETSNEKLFNFLHSACGRYEKKLDHRLLCLTHLKELGYQVGTGVMIGIPGQTLQDLCNDIRMFQKIDADMIGMGPYLMSEAADLCSMGQMPPKPLLQLTLNMIAVTRLVMHNINIAAATALDVLAPDGRIQGILHGCNVMMPNLSPQRYRAGYQLYDHKPSLKDDPTNGLTNFEKLINSTGRQIGWNQSGSSPRWLVRNGL